MNNIFVDVRHVLNVFKKIMDQRHTHKNRNVQHGRFVLLEFQGLLFWHGARVHLCHFTCLLFKAARFKIKIPQHFIKTFA